MIVFALTSHGIDTVIFRVANVLEVPVLVLALAALAAVLFELGSFAVEMRSRRRRGLTALTQVVAGAQNALREGDARRAGMLLSGIAQSTAMAETLRFILAVIASPRGGGPAGEHQLNKALADFSFDSQRRLGRTRLLVRAGPALGLMGTLIPLSPALTGLARGDTSTLSENLRVAFSVTVVGLLIGAIAFGLSLWRDRIYGQDHSDLEYIAAVLSDARTAPRPR